ncbi:MAG: 4Fe-4S dicluster domain-containing protein [Sedimentisphaerales bacterium]|nr:4Fe-4S dicluster domain-containing protein [Sedimentisphaerales bacterium]
MKVSKQQKNVTLDPGFAGEIQRRSGENVFMCYQCRKCASGCPSRMFMDSTPTELMRYAQLGMADEAMKKNTIWYCLSCQTCSARCPADIDIAHVVDTMRIIVQERKIKAQSNKLPLFNRLWMTMIKFMGRAYEPGIVVSLNLLSGKPAKDIGLGMKMIRKGKLKLWPSFKKPFAMIKMFAGARRLKK